MTTSHDAAPATPDRSPAHLALPWTAAVPAVLVVAGAVVGLAAAQGGYFATSWGWASTALLWVIGIWLVTSGRTQAGRLDVVFAGLLGAFTAWIAVSIVWSAVPAQTVLELERALVPLAGVAAFLALARLEQVPVLTGALLASITAVSAYALVTRLFPDRLGAFDSIAVYRLSDPVGYWNALGIFAVLGLLVAAGVAADGARAWTRAAAAAAAVILAPTLYFTFSRGSWFALGIGFAALLAVSPRRLHALTSSVVATAPAALAVALASRSDALTHQEAALAPAVEEGRRLALALVVLAAVAVALGVALHVADRRLPIPRVVRAGYAGLLVLGLAVGVAALVAQYGSPASIADRAWTAFSAPPPATSSDLNSRLFNLSGNGRVDLWRAAGDLAGENPLTGNGGGTFERYWQSLPDASLKVRDAHGLFVETLAELGPIGLALLVVALSVPLAAGLIARRSRFAPFLLGAYVAFIAHASVDWDWEMSGIVLTALLAGSLLVVSARRGTVGVLPGGWRVAGAAAVLALSAVALVGLLGNSALAGARSAVDQRDLPQALEESDRAETLMPWSPWPWIARGEAQLVTGLRGEAAMSFRKAIDVDEGEWRGWYGLALATGGAERRAALARARALYPKSPAVARAIARDTT